MSRNPHRHPEVCRYVELHPVRAAMVAHAKDWPWSSYRAHVGQADVPAWLGSEELWGYLLGRDVDSDADLAQAQHAYADLVATGRHASLWDESLNRQIYLGDEQFVARMLDAALPSAKRSAPVPKVQRSTTRTLSEWLAHCPPPRGSAAARSRRKRPEHDRHGG